MTEELQIALYNLVTLEYVVDEEELIVTLEDGQKIDLFEMLRNLAKLLSDESISIVPE